MKYIRLIWDGMKLFFILPLCFVSRKAFDHFWDKYYMKVLRKNMFNLCVEWLLYKGEKYGLSYEKINVVVFCIIWPLLTIISILLNVILIISLASR